jgi:hypothetical protein
MWEVHGKSEWLSTVCTGLEIEGRRPLKHRVPKDSALFMLYGMVLSARLYPCRGLSLFDGPEM